MSNTAGSSNPRSNSHKVASAGVMRKISRSEITGASKSTTLTGTARQLWEKLESKTATIGVVGLGYVGLPLAVEHAKQGFRTIGIDLNHERVLRLNEGENYIQDVADQDLKDVVDGGFFTAVDDFSCSADIDVFYICVPTPVTEHKDPDVGYIRSAAREIAARIRPGQLIVLKSTTYPDTTEGVVLPIIVESARPQDLQLGRDFFLAFSPERIDPGNEKFTTANTPVVVGGVTDACTELACKAMNQVVDHIHPVSSPKVAEMEKLLENIFRSVNIALVNELARLCDRMGGISIWEVVEAAATKPFGYMPFTPGPGIGGHCIPVDPYYLSWLARRYDFETSFITLAARINEEMPYTVVDAVTRAIARQAVSLPEANVLILGVAFKKDVDDVRHAPALKVIELLRDSGVRNIRFADPHVSKVRVTGKTWEMDLEPIEITDEVLRNHHVSVILTEHSAFSYAQIAKQSNVIVDTRNALRDIPHDREKVMLLGGGNF
jgi:UDP-N-acetyl-D-glucosamine dehydrogenase